MSTEDRVREALRAHTETVHPTGSYEDVRERAAQARRARRTRTTALTGLAAAAAVAVVALAVAVVTGDDTPQQVDVGPAQPGDSTTTTTTTTATATDDQLRQFVFVTGETDPRLAAERFAVEYLGMTDPVIGAFQAGGPVDGEVPVHATGGGAVTTVGVREVPGDHVWGVVFAASDNIRVTSPGPFDAVASPVLVAGTARAYEGTVQVEVRQDGQLAGQSLGAGFVTGSGGFEHGPFEGEVAFDRPTVAAGAVVFYTESAEDGSVWEATVVRVTFE